MNKKLLPVVVTLSLVLSFLLAIPAGANAGPPLPEELWSYNTTGDVTDIAVGDLNGDEKDDVVAIEVSADTLTAISGDGPEDWQWGDLSMAGYAVAVGDINNDSWNEVIAGGLNGTAWVLNAYDKDGNILWSYPVTGQVKDIEIGDVDGDGIDDVVACNSVASHIYAINGTGQNITGLWPITSTPTPVVDLAIGQLDGQAGVDVAAIGEAIAGCLYVYNSTGSLMWSNSGVRGRTVEIGDVDGDGDNEVVAAHYGSGNPVPSGGWVLAFDGDEGGPPLYSFYTEPGKIISDIELGDLDGNPADVEVAAITEPVDATLFAIDIDNGTEQEMWSYSIDWDTRYYGESLAIGDVDRDYKNEVVAASSVPPHCIYAFDGIDRDGDGFGDLVWSPYCVWEPITDVEVGDLDGDGDDDVAFGTVGGRTIYAIKAVESKTEAATGTGTVYFDSDPSTLENLTPVSELPEEGKPDLEFPHGFFSFNIRLPSTNYTSAIVTMTFPSPLPVGTQYWKYGPTPSDPTDHWYQLPIGDDDGDNVITITLFDGELGDDNVVALDGVIVDQGGPGIPTAPVGGEAYPVNKLAILAPWIALAAAIIAGATIFIRRRRAES
ncbi:MAG: VCBS repeat-containing protein [Dehalococcoidia bacterium]